LVPLDKALNGIRVFPMGGAVMEKALNY